MERLDSVAWEGFSGKFTPAQIARQTTWGGVPDNEMTMAAVHVIHQVPRNASTLTYVNPVDPGDGGWLENPDKGWDTTIPAGRM